ncbi:hypothetical protein BOX15_Mlig021560g2, partial [Macrostomum lignano]
FSSVFIMATAQQQQEMQQQQQQQQTCWWSYTWPHSRSPQPKSAAKPQALVALGSKPVKRTISSGVVKKRLQQQQQQKSHQVLTLTIKAGNVCGKTSGERFQQRQRAASPLQASSVLGRRQQFLQQQQQMDHQEQQQLQQPLSVCLQCADWVECQSAHKQATGHVTYQPVSAAAAAYYKCLECHMRMVNQRQVSDHMRRIRHVNFVRMGINGGSAAAAAAAAAAATFPGGVGGPTTFAAAQTSTVAAPAMANHVDIGGALLSTSPPGTTETSSTSPSSATTVLASLNFADCDRLLDPFAMFDDALG